MFVAVPAGGSISNSVFGDVDLALSLCKVKTQKSLRDFRVFGFSVQPRISGFGGYALNVLFRPCFYLIYGA